jgi:hypothetical protein
MFLLCWSSSREAVDRLASVALRTEENMVVVVEEVALLTTTVLVEDDDLYHRTWYTDCNDHGQKEPLRSAAARHTSYR